MCADSGRQDAEKIISGICERLVMASGTKAHQVHVELRRQLSIVILLMARVFKSLRFGLFICEVDIVLHFINTLMSFDNIDQIAGSNT